MAVRSGLSSNMPTIVEEGDKWLVAGLDVERIIIEGNPLNRPQDRVQDRLTSDCKRYDFMDFASKWRTVSNATNVLV